MQIAAECVIKAKENGAILVSVVIPTRNRPLLVGNAVRSVLNQTHTNIEIIVVVDGPDPITVESLQAIGSSQLKTIVNAENLGLAETRNVGVRNAAGNWVAFLDDDDEWLPRKLEKQLALAEQYSSDCLILGCRYIEKTTGMERIAPSVLPGPFEDISEYVYCKRGFIQPSTIFTSKNLLYAVPFTKEMAIEDTEWLLRAVQDAGALVQVLPEALSVFNNASTQGRLGGAGPWEPLLTWGIANRSRFTKRSFPLFVVMECVTRSRLRKEPLYAKLYLLLTGWMFGAFSIESVCYFLGYLLLGSHQRRKVRNILVGTEKLRLIEEGYLGGWSKELEE
jgi:glycosyltransferase involved in cell wall biosynthesis